MIQMIWLSAKRNLLDNSDDVSTGSAIHNCIIPKFKREVYAQIHLVSLQMNIQFNRLLNGLVIILVI